MNGLFNSLQDAAMKAYQAVTQEIDKTSTAERWRGDLCSYHIRSREGVELATATVDGGVYEHPVFGSEILFIVTVNGKTTSCSIPSAWNAMLTDKVSDFGDLR